MIEQYPYKEIEPTPQFFLSWDVELLTDLLCVAKQWNPPKEATFQRAKQMLTCALTSAFENAQTVIIDGKDIATEIQRTVLALKKSTGLPVVTMDPLYGASVADFSLNTTRGLNSDGSIQEIARPGYPDISEQITRLARTLDGNRKIYLIDAGAYSGGSMQTIIKLLQRYNVIVETVILGIATDEAKRTLWSPDVGPPIVINSIQKPIDWVEARDFIPFVPLCGRVINEPVQSGVLSRALPYILPEGKPDNWASIPPGKNYRLSKTGWDISEIIFQDLEIQNGIRIELTDLVDLPVRVSYPGEVIPGLTNVIDVIRAKRQMLQYQSYGITEGI